MESLSAEAAETLRAAAEVFVPGPPHDPTPGAADVSAELFLHHYLEFMLPGLSSSIAGLLDALAHEHLERRFVALTLSERERVLDRLAEHADQQLRELPEILGVLSIAAVYGEWSGQNADGALVREPLGWQLAGYPGPTRGTPRLLKDLP